MYICGVKMLQIYKLVMKKNKIRYTPCNIKKDTIYNDDMNVKLTKNQY